MSSSFTQTTLFLVLFIGGIICTASSKSNTCVVKINDRDECFPFFSVPQNCKSAKLNLSQTYVAKSCTTANLFWNYPQSNLTLIIETLYTRKHQSYTLHFPYQLDQQLQSLYQVCPAGTLTKLKSRNDTINVKSDANYQVVLKLQASKLQLYAVMIEYNVIKN